VKITLRSEEKYSSIIWLQLTCDINLFDVLCNFFNSGDQPKQVVSRTLYIPKDDGVGNGTRSSVTNITVHAEYDGFTFLNNIAIWKVSFYDQ